VQNFYHGNKKSGRTTTAGVGENFIIELAFALGGGGCE
jgi:hypothetical protein